MSLGPDANPHKHHHFDLYPRNNHAAELKVFPAAGAGRMPRSLLIVLFAVGALFAAGQLLVHWLAALPRLPARGVAHPEPAGQKIRFATIATHPDMHARLLNESCAPHDVEFLGVGTVYNSSRNKLDHMMHWIRTLDPNALVVVIDSNDAVCLPCDRDQRTEFLKLGHDIVFGGDCVAVPDESLADWFPIPPEKPSTAMRFLNAGTMMGRASAIQYYCTRHYLRSGRHHDEGLRDQRFWQDQFLAGYNKYLAADDEPTIGIDYDGRLFQMVGSAPGCGMNCWGMNTTTGYLQVKAECQERLYSGPACILHGPGGAKGAFWRMTDTIGRDTLRRGAEPWVDLF